MVKSTVNVYPAEGGSKPVIKPSSKNAQARIWAFLLMNVFFSTVHQDLEQIELPKEKTTVLSKALTKVLKP